MINLLLAVLLFFCPFLTGMDYIAKKKIVSAACSQTDNFNRGDGGLGADWTTWSGFSAPAITSNQVTGPSGTDGGAYRSVGCTWNSNHYAEVTITTLNDSGGPAVRIQSGAASGYLAIVVGTNGLFQLYRASAGTFTAIVDPCGSNITAGTRIRLEASGSTISVLADAAGGTNFTSKCSTTDTNHTGGAPGVYLFHNLVRIDDWTGGNL